MNDLYYDTVIHQSAVRNGFDVVETDETKGKNYRRLASTFHYGVLHADKDGEFFVLYDYEMKEIARVAYDNDCEHFSKLAAVLDKLSDEFIAALHA